MANTWNSPVSGNWTTASDWSTGVAPTTGTDATIAAAGAYTVTVDSSVGVQTLTLDATGATLLDSGTLSLGTSLDLLAGALDLTGTIIGGTILDGVGGLIPDGGTLTGAAYDGTGIGLGGSGQTFNLSNGTTIRNLAGNGPGLISLFGYADTLVFDGDATFDNATIDLSSATFSYNDPNDNIEENGPAGAVLTLGSNAVVNIAYNEAFIAAGGATSIANQGTINVTGAAGVLSISVSTFSNAGSILVANGDALYVSGSGFSENAGGVVSVTGAGSAMHISGSPTDAILAGVTVASGGGLDIDGTLNNDGQTLDIGTGSTISALVLNGTIVSGTIIDGGTGLIPNGGTLSGVAYDGTGIGLGGSGQTFNLSNGTTIRNLAGNGPGLISLFGYADTLVFDGDATFDNATIDLSSATFSYNDPNDNIEENGPAGAVLTLGSNAVVNIAYNEAFIAAGGATSIANQGTINVTGAAGVLSISVSTFSNAGSILVANGDALYVSGSGFSENAGGVVSVTGAGSAMHISGSPTDAILAGVTVASGGGLDIDGTLNNDGQTLDIGTGSTISALVLNGTIVSGTIIDGGTGLIPNGGTLSGVAYDGTGIGLGGSGQTFNLSNGTTIRNLAGNGPGLISLFGYADTLVFDGDATFDNATIDLSSATFSYNDPNDNIEENGPAGAVLTLGSNAVVKIAYNEAFIAAGGATSMANQGTINVTGAAGVLSISVPTFSNAGSILVANGDALYVSGSGFSENAGGVVSVTGAGSAMHISGSATNAILAGVTFDAGAVLDVDGTLHLSGASLAVPLLGITQGGTLVGFGAVLSPIIDNGIIIADGGNLDLKAGDPGAGSALIAAGATLELGAPFAEAITFAAGGIDTLALDNPADATGILAGFAFGDTIDFLGTIVSSATIAGSSLLVDIGTGTFAYELAGTFAGAPVIVTPDGAGTGSNVSIACFCRGTRILTPLGEVAVEDLVVGDELVTRLGEARRVRWIGHRAYAGRFAAANPDVLPIRLREGAFGGGVPKRDLYVSPQHAFYLDHVLIPAVALVNEATIQRVEAVEQVVYYHLELTTQDVIFAEGAGAETYLDDGNRGMFDNAGEIAGSGDPVRYYAPRLAHGPEVDAVRARLAAHAIEAGSILPAAETVALEAVGLHRVTLAAGISKVHFASPPAHAPGDRRPLGALILAVRLDGTALDLADTRLARGFHASEWHDRRCVRWTNGDGVLKLTPVATEQVLEIEVGALPPKARGSIKVDNARRRAV